MADLLPGADPDPFANLPENEGADFLCACWKSHFLLESNEVDFASEDNKRFPFSAGREGLPVDEADNPLAGGLKRSECSQGDAILGVVS